MRRYIENYISQNSTANDDLENYANDLINSCGEDILINKEPKQLKNLVSTDLRDNIPPQIYFVVSELIEVIKSIENSKR